jgi:peptide chain release factor 3
LTQLSGEAAGLSSREDPSAHNVVQEKNIIVSEAARRRTFAIISHPDAGKTTLTEKFLLYAGQIAEAGAVKARSGRRQVTSDWMSMEQQRGISITSTVIQFTYRSHVINLLDTPGHRDFSEDTYRVLAAVDAAIMVLDAAKGIEAQTLKLFEVCAARRIPILTFINKYDRPGKEILELLDEIETQIGLKPTPVTWPVGIAGDFRGVVDRRSGLYIKYQKTARGAHEALEETSELGLATDITPAVLHQTQEELSLLEAVGADLDVDSFLEGKTTPLFVGSALTNFGVQHILDAVVDLAPAPCDKEDASGKKRSLAEPFSGFVFKIQANMDPAHRDNVAFVRVCSGCFQRGMVVTHEKSKKSFATKYATSVFGNDRSTIDTAYPGDVVGLVNAGDLSIGDSLYGESPVTYPPIPAFAPELFSYVTSKDVSKYKQFKKGLEQMAREGVVQVYNDLDPVPNPIIAAVGQMQFEVFSHRLINEFKVPVEIRPTKYHLIRKSDPQCIQMLQNVSGAKVVKDFRGETIVLIESPYWLSYIQSEYPEIFLTPVSQH